MDPEEIARLIRAGLPDSQVRVEGDGRHFQAEVVSPAFAGKSMLQQHRMVYGVLGEHFKRETLHALSLSTRAPG